MSDEMACTASFTSVTMPLIAGGRLTAAVGSQRRVVAPARYGLSPCCHLLVVHDRDELLLVVDGGSRVTAGYFTHQAINLKLQRLVAAWSRP